MYWSVRYGKTKDKTNININNNNMNIKVYLYIGESNYHKLLMYSTITLKYWGRGANPTSYCCMRYGRRETKTKTKTKTRWQMTNWPDDINLFTAVIYSFDVNNARCFPWLVQKSSVRIRSAFEWRIALYCSSYNSTCRLFPRLRQVFHLQYNFDDFLRILSHSGEHWTHKKIYSALRAFSTCANNWVDRKCLC